MYFVRENFILEEVKHKTLQNIALYYWCVFSIHFNINVNVESNFLKVVNFVVCCTLFCNSESIGTVSCRA